MVPVHTDRNHGRNSIADGGTLAIAGRQQWADAIIAHRYHNYGMEITDLAIEATRKGDEGSFVRLLEAESKGLAQDMKKDMNRQAFGTGDGMLSAVSSNSTSTTVNVSSVQYIKVNDRVDVLVQATGATTNGVVGAVVTARDASAKTITIDTALAGTAGTTYGVYISGSYGNEMDGLRNMASASRTLHSINSATAGNEYWNGQVVDSGSSDSATSIGGEDLFVQAADLVGATGNGEVDAFLTSRGVRRRLANQFASQKRFTDANATKIEAGYSAIMVNGEMPVIVDDDCPKGRAFGFSKDALKWFEVSKPGFVEQQDGGIFHLKASSTAGRRDAVWQAWFRWIAALGCVAPNRVVQIRYLTDDNPS